MLSRMMWAFFLNLGFAIFELIGGLWVNSVAIVSDAIHDFGDALSLALGIWMEHKSKQGGDHRFSYGYRRFSLLAAVFTGGVLVTGSCFVLGHAVQRVLDPQPVNAPWMIAFAVVGVAVNGFAFFRLRAGDEHDHHHHHHHHGAAHAHHDHSRHEDHAGHDHGGKDGGDHPHGTGSIHGKVWELHFIEDLLGWVIVLIGGIAMTLYPLPWLDGAMAIALSLWIIYNAFKNLKTTFVILLQGMPSQATLPAVEKLLAQWPEIFSFHHLHLWSLDGQAHILTGHLVIKNNVTLTELAGIKSRIKAELRKKFQIREATFEFECEGEACGDPDHKN